jgi:dienelactone hydrolase
MIDQQIEIPTKDGHTTTFISHPERNGPHPVILFYMDAPGFARNCATWRAGWRRRGIM